MFEIQHSPEKFISALEQGKPIVFESDGTWNTCSRLTALMRCTLKPLFGWNDTLTTARNVSYYLFENSSVIKTQGLIAGSWESSTLKRLISAIKRSIASQKKEEEIQLLKLKRTLEYPSLSQTDVIQLRQRLSRPRHGNAQAVCAQLDRAYLSHHYLGISQQKIASTVPKNEDVSWIREELLKWQTLPFPAADFFSEENIAGTQSKILRCCQFPKFIRACRENSALLKLFFYSAFYSLPADCDDSADLFIQAPKIQKELARLHIDKRIKAVANKGLRFVETSSELPAKDVHLLIDGEYQSISNPSNQVRVAENVTRTVRNLFKTFEEYYYKIPDLEYLQDGVTLFDSRLPDFDLSAKDWWKNLPIIQKVTREELETLYDISFETGEALLVLRASRATPDSIVNAHAWMDLAVPLDDGTFNLLSAGKSSVSPRTLLSTFFSFFNSHEATITLVDPTKFMSSRERVSVPFNPLSKDQFDDLMAALARDITLAREGGLVFQALSDNCASWLLKIIKEIFPDLDIQPFWIPYQDLVAPGILKSLITLHNRLPKRLQKTYMFCIARLFGATPKTLSGDKWWEMDGFEVPNQLFFTKEETDARIRGAATTCLT